MKPLAIDLFCGLGGWSSALLAEGYDCVGFDIERHRYPELLLPDADGGIKAPGSNIKLGVGRDKANARAGSFNYANECAAREAPATGRWLEYPAQLVIQDVLTLHGSQFRDAALIVASPPCQEFSYMAMPWSLAKAKAAAIRADGTGKAHADLNALFDACFRIQSEACEATGRHIPLIVENVRGAQPWVGRARWSFGSFYLWGDVPALMPVTRLLKITVDPSRHRGDGSLLANIVTGDGIKGAHGTPGSHWTNPAEHEGTKGGGDWFGGHGTGDYAERNRHWSGSTARKAASAMIAKIPPQLARHIARTFLP